MICLSLFCFPKYRDKLSKKVTKKGARQKITSLLSDGSLIKRWCYCSFNIRSLVITSEDIIFLSYSSDLNSNGDLQFIHSSSGKAYGVTVSPLKGYYSGRFVKVIRIF